MYAPPPLMANKSRPNQLRPLSQGKGAAHGMVVNAAAQVAELSAVTAVSAPVVGARPST